MARRTRPTTPPARPPEPSTRRPGEGAERHVATPDLDVDAERALDGALPEELTVTHGDEVSPEREEAERAIEARDEPDGSLDERLHRLEAQLEEIRERLDEDDDERLHYRDLGTEGLEYVDEQIAP